MQPRSSEFSPKANCAVLVDGENISQRAADDILNKSSLFGSIRVRRVYGNVAAIPSWEASAGFEFVHSGCGKNSADMKLAIDAMTLCFARTVDTVIVVSSDGDFTHLALALREKGINVVGMGEHKAPEKFRRACSAFLPLDHFLAPATTAALPSKKNCISGGLTRKLVSEISQSDDGLKIASLNTIMYRQFQVKISEYKEKTWRGYLTNRPEIFDCDTKGPDARVRLKSCENVLELPTKLAN